MGGGHHDPGLSSVTYPYEYDDYVDEKMWEDEELDGGGCTRLTRTSWRSTRTSSAHPGACTAPHPGPCTGLHKTAVHDAALQFARALWRGMLYCEIVPGQGQPSGAALCCQLAHVAMSHVALAFVTLAQAIADIDNDGVDELVVAASYYFLTRE